MRSMRSMRWDYFPYSGALAKGMPDTDTHASPQLPPGTGVTVTVTQQARCGKAPAPATLRWTPVKVAVR
jgi:hypothetical protein